MILGAMLFLVGLILLVIITITIAVNIKNSNNNSELESIEKSHEIERACEIIKLENDLAYLEKAYDTFKTYINCDSIYLGIYRYFINLRLEGKNIHKYICMHISKSPFNQSELDHLRTLFDIPDLKKFKFISNPDKRYKLNKGTALYTLIINRIDRYYKNQIYDIRNKLQLLN